ncbi:MAG: hypothetical protein FJZ38_02805 [Candidatus Rokubacteria bacterium]|nr:hypothetical protein [Candidatus Rokubacteria bacterium]
MSTDRGYIARNNDERARLKALVSKCSDADLATPMPAGWTVAGVLGHLAFWDQRIVLLLDQWEKKGIVPTHEVAADVDWINDAAKPMLLAVPPRALAQIAVASAEAADRKAETLSDELVAKNAAARLLNLARADHRKEHLDDIERVLSGKA